MPEQLDLDQLIAVSRECLSLLAADRVEEYLALEGERRHLFDNLPPSPPPESKSQLEELKSVTDALAGEVARKMSEMQKSLSARAPEGLASESQGSGYSSWA